MTERDNKTSEDWFQRLKKGLDKSTNKISSAISNAFLKQKIDDDIVETIEDILIQGDVGISVASKLSNIIANTKFEADAPENAVREVLAKEIQTILEPVEKSIEVQNSNRPNVILVCGVNGVGKTTTIGKLAYMWQREGKVVTLVAADTFRAAAVEQLKIWGDRVGCAVFSGNPGADPAALVYRALDETFATKVDIVIIDTAGRVQNRADLMDELEKIVRVIKKIDASAPHDTLLVLDATIGQNSINQVKVFNESVNLSGLIFSKLDGTAKGGVAVAIAEKFNLPVYAIGVGEGIEDLSLFNAYTFSRSLLGLGPQKF